jgi:hypothetical protein
MDQDTISSAVLEIWSLVGGDPEQIDYGVVNQQLSRMEKAGAPVRKHPSLRRIIDQIYDNISRLKGWPLSDAPDRAKLVDDTRRLCMAITVDAHLIEQGE